MRLKFYLATTSTFLLSSIIGFLTGGEVLRSILTTKFGRPYGEEVFAFLFYMSIGGFVGFALGVLISLIIIERLGRRWGPQLNFGSHPVLKLTALSFLTFLGLLVLLLFFIPSKS